MFTHNHCLHSTDYVVGEPLVLAVWKIVIAH